MNWLARLISSRVRELEAEIASDKKYEAGLIKRVGEAELKLKSRESSPFAKTVAEITKPKSKGDLVWREDARKVARMAATRISLLNHCSPSEIEGAAKLASDWVDSLPAAESHDLYPHIYDDLYARIVELETALKAESAEIAWMQTVAAGNPWNALRDQQFTIDKKNSLINDLKEQIRIKDGEIKEQRAYIADKFYANAVVHELLRDDDSDPDNAHLAPEEREAFLRNGIE
jgi:hypothetical protein